MSTQLITIIFLGAILRIIGIFAVPITFDEAYTVLASKITNIYEIATTTAYSHPPLYFIILHFWQLLSSNLVFARMLSLIFGIATIVAIFKVGEELVNRQVGELAALFAAVSPTLIYYSAIARMYSLAILLALLIIFFFIKFLRNESGMLSLVLITIAGLYTHYFMSILFFSLVVWALFVQKKFQVNYGRLWMLSTTLVILYMPALFLLITSTKSISQPENSLFKLPAMFASLTIPWDVVQLLKIYQSNRPDFTSLVALLLILISFALFLWGTIILRKKIYIFFFSFLCLFSSILILAISLIFIKIAGIRSFVIFSSAFILLAAASVTQMSVAMRKITTLSILTLSLIFMELYAWNSFGPKDLEQRVWSNFESNDFVVYNDVTFFLPSKVVGVDGTHLLMYPGHLPQDELKKLGVNLATFRDIPLTKKVWYVKVRTRWPPYEEFTDKLEAFLENNFSEVKRISYYGDVYVREGLTIAPIPYYPLQLVLFVPKSP